MTMARAAIILLVILSPVFMSACITHRPIHIFVRPDNVTVKCIEPPADVILKSGDAKVNAAVKGIGELIKAESTMKVEVQKIRELSAGVNNFEVIEFRLCTQYGNGVLTPQQFQRIQDEILPMLHSESSKVSKAETQLRFEADLKQANFIRHPSNKRVRAEFVWMLRPVLGDNQLAAHIFIGEASLWDDELLGCLEREGTKASDCKGQLKPIRQKVWSELQENPVIVRGGTQGSYVTWITMLPVGVKIIQLSWDFYQREADNNAFCRIMETPYVLPPGLPLLETADLSGIPTKDLCYHSYDSRVFAVPS